MAVTGTFEDMEQAYSEVTDFFKDNKCSGCGNCCTRYLVLSNKEINQIRAYIKRHNITQQKHLTNVLNTKVFDMVCPFLNDNDPDHKCTIYDVRPQICKEFTCRGYIEGFKPSKDMLSTPRTKVDMVETFFEKEN